MWFSKTTISPKLQEATFNWILITKACIIHYLSAVIRKTCKKYLSSLKTKTFILQLS